MKKKSKNSISPKKYLGQNFLIDKNVINKIITFCELDERDHVLEIGPGLGALTGEIATRVSSLVAVEKDFSLAQEISNLNPDLKIKIFNKDILGFDFSKLEKKVKVVGNIPYNISSLIIKKLIENSKFIHSSFLTVQLEFANRLVAKPSTKDYGSLTCFIQYHANPRLLFKIKNSCFRPIPKVQSAFICLDFNKKLPTPAKDKTLLFSIIRQSFQQRRKTILNSLSSKYEKSEIESVFAQCKISPKLRAENLTLEEFINISNCFLK